MKKRQRTTRAVEPRFNFAKSTGRGREGLARALEVIRAAKRGKPKAGELSVESKPRSVRLPDNVWEELEIAAGERDMARHELLRRILVDWLEQHRAS